MGKLKKRSRSSRHRANPLAGRNLNNSGSNAGSQGNNQDDALKTSKIKPLIEKLSSTNTNDRSMALGSISVLAEDAKFRQLLLKEKLLHIIMNQSLTDSNSEIIVEALGLLRNLVIEEGYDVSIYLWRQKIWEFLRVNLSKADESFESLINNPQSSSKIENGLLFDYIENLISLIVGLGDSSDDIFVKIYEEIEPIVEFITKILRKSINLEKKTLLISVSLFNTILDFIYDFSSQSDQFITDLINKWELNLDVLYSFVEEQPRFNELSKIYIQGIKLQSLEFIQNDKQQQTTQLHEILFKSLEYIKDINIETNREILISPVDNTKVEELNKDTKLRVEARSKFQAIELALEVITATIEIIANTNNLELDQENNQLINILTQNIPQALLHLTSHLEFRPRSLTALNNLNWLFITTYSSFHEVWIDVVKTIWDSLYSILNEEVDVEEKISIFSTLWAIVIALGNDLVLSDGFVTKVIDEFGKVVQNEEIDQESRDEYLIRLVGFLGNLAKQQHQVARNLQISQLFINVLHQVSKVPISVIIEILDIFYEIYGDEDFDYDEPVFVKNNYLAVLQNLQPKIRSEVKLIDKNKNPELKLKSEDVLNNLGRFIQYKKDERK